MLQVISILSPEVLLSIHRLISISHNIISVAFSNFEDEGPITNDRVF